MNQRKAKAIRRKVYGDMSQKKRTYARNGQTIICTGLRAEYKQAKRAAKA